jgi:TIR domain
MGTAAAIIAADWSKQGFDVVQMRTVRYPLPEGMITEQTAQAFGSAVKGEIQRRAADASSPVYKSIRGYPSNVGEQAASTMKDQMTQVAIFQAESPTKRVQFDVFLCYNKQDKVAVRRLNETLKKEGIRTWLDEEQIKPGDIWQRKIEEIISSVPAVLVIVGDSKIGPFQDMEQMSIITEFVRRGCKVVPVFIGSPSQTIPGLPLLLKPFMWSDLREHDGHQVAEIISTLRTLDRA